MWIRVEHQNAEAYVDLDRVVKIVFRPNKEGTQVESATLLAVGATEMVALGKVSGDASLKQLRQHISLLRGDNPVV